MTDTKTTDVSSALLEHLPVPTFGVDSKGKVTFWNEKVAALTGRSAKEMKGKKAWTAFYDKRAATPVELALRSEEEEEEAAFVVTHKETGEQHKIRFNATPIMNGTDEPSGVVATLSEMGADANASQAVKDLSNIPTPIMRIDREFNITYMNPAGAGVVGLTPDECLGKKCFNLFKTPHCNTPECRCAQAMQNDGVFEGETVADPAGLNLPISYTAAPVKDEYGKIVGALEFVLNISETKKAMSDAQLKVDYLNNIPTPVMVIDRDFTVQFINPAGAGVLGATPAQVQGNKCYDLFKTPHCRTSECRCAQAMQQASVFTGETVADPKGLNLPIEYTGAPIKDAHGNVIGALEYVVDITDRKLVLNDIIAVAQAMAANDLTSQATGDYEGDFLAIAENLNRAVSAQHDTMIQVAEAVEQITSAASQIASSSQQVAEGASEQASSLEETSSSLEEMSGMTKQNADNTQQARGLAETTKTAATKGTSAMVNMTSAMTQIKQSAEGTAQIIRDINEIAFQTNLLALNAAVEAARAGDAGRGFAVVAEEVRNLAGRAKDAAKKTEELIKDSVTMTERGETISADVGESLTEIANSVGKVTDIVGEIAGASQEQARGIDQINRAVNEMDKVVQTSAANSEESSSAAEELAGQAQDLASMVGRFQLNRRQQTRVQPAPTQPRAAQPRAAKSKAAQTRNKGGNGQSKFRIKPEDVIPMENDPDFAEF